MIKITECEAEKIIETGEPIGRFYFKGSRGKFVGIDNDSGEAFVEEFDTMTECIKWLNKYSSDYIGPGRKMIVYIAGKITGQNNYKELFNDAEYYLKELGFIVLNPAILPSTGLRYEQYMRIGKAMLEEADIIYLLSNWIDSPGAIKEMKEAEKLGKIIIGENYYHE